MGQINLRWLSKIDRALHSGIQEYAVQIRVGVGDTRQTMGQNTDAMAIWNRGVANVFANWSIFCRSAMSNFIALAFCCPCLRTKSSSRACLRPTAMTLEPSWTRRSAIAAPMPDVAPIMRICLYWKGIFEIQGFVVGEMSA